MTQPLEGTIKMETVKDEEGSDKIVWREVEPRTDWARLDKDLNLVHLDMDLCAQGPANVYTALAIGVWNAAVKAEREACAKVCDDYDVKYDVCSSDTAESIAAAIRAREST
jgi:hypothetical protein